MSQSQITVVGNVVDSPVRRRAGSGEVTKFRMAATIRASISPSAPSRWRRKKTARSGAWCGPAGS